MELLYVLLVLLLVTRTLGEVAARFGQPVLVGELLSGVLLGILVRTCAPTFPIPRGAVELIVADVALRSGLFDHPQPPHPLVSNLFSAVAVMTVCAAVASPVALRLVLGRR